MDNADNSRQFDGKVLALARARAIYEKIPQRVLRDKNCQTRTRASSPIFDSRNFETDKDKASSEAYQRSKNRTTLR